MKPFRHTLVGVMTLASLVVVGLCDSRTILAATAAERNHNAPLSNVGGRHPVMQPKEKAAVPTLNLRTRRAIALFGPPIAPDGSRSRHFQGGRALTVTDRIDPNQPYCYIVADSSTASIAANVDFELRHDISFSEASSSSVHYFMVRNGTRYRFDCIDEARRTVWDAALIRRITGQAEFTLVEPMARAR